MKYIVLLGRIFYSAIFILSSFKHFDINFVAYAAGAGVPAPSLLVPLSGTMILIGGINILLGYRTRGSAWLIVLFLVPVTLIIHRFWGLPDPQMAMQQQAHFMKNLSILGGALLITAFGAGPLSLDSLRKRLAVEEKKTEPPVMKERDRTPVASGLRER